MRRSSLRLPGEQRIQRYHEQHGHRDVEDAQVAPAREPARSVMPKAAQMAALGALITAKTRCNWVRQVRRGKTLVSRMPAVPIDDTQAELSRLCSEVARPRLDNEILKAAAYFARQCD